MPAGRQAGFTVIQMKNGFDSETNAEFIRFLRYAKRSCTEVQSELYVALDEEYISTNEFKPARHLAGGDVYEQARRIPQKRDCRSWIHQLSQKVWRAQSSQP